MAIFGWGKKPTPAPTVEAFSFGELKNTADYLDGIMGAIFRTWHNGRYYEMPFSPQKIYDAQFLAPHHASAMQLKVNLLCDLFQPSRYLSLLEFRKFAHNAIVMGNGYLQEKPNINGAAMGYQSVAAMYVRRIDDVKYGYFPREQTQRHDLTEIDGHVVHFVYDDLSQDFYGKPYYLPALAAANLNNQATKFRDLYYRNGNHAGFILYLSDPAHSLEDVKALRQAMIDSKGPGAFRNLFFYSPKGKKDGMQVIPVESATAQDKFTDIKNVSMGDLMAQHRIPPNMMAVQSSNAGGFGNITEARQAMIQNEIVPIARLMQATHPVLQFKTD